MWIFFVVPGVLLLLLLLLLLPTRARFFARASAGVSRIRIELRLFRCIPLRMTLRLHLLSEPYFTLLHFDRHGGLRQIPLVGGKKKLDWRRFVSLDRVHATYLVGLEDDAAATAFLCGAVSTAGELALLRLFEEVRTTPQPVFTRSILRINLEGIVSVKPAKSIRILLQKK